MIFLLDTTALSAVMAGEPGHVRQLLTLRPADVAVPQPAVAEIRYGLARLGRSRRRQTLEERLELVLESLQRSEWTDEVSRRFGEVRADLERRGERIDDMDVMIAAHGLAAQATVVTSNLRHFARVGGLTVVDWSAKAS